MVDVLRKRLVVVAVLIIIVLGGSCYAYWQKNSVPTNVSTEGVLSLNNGANRQGSVSTVYISGAVMQPGVIKVSGGSRIIDVINAAGGLTEGADITKLNLAQPVKDGMHIKVLGGVVALSQTLTGHSDSAKAVGDKININTASKSELDKLPGIGATLAQRIIDYRQANGQFKDCSELRKVTGISESRYNKLKDKIII